MSKTLERLEAIEERYDEITQRLSDPEIARQPTEYQKLAREEGELKEVVSVATAYRQGNQS
ncbi:MAG TPA: peptide chain release factor 1, partial [Candidatus Latescibacteria bacterium]|nr:peptide chain release factor 1 [Candidatus Latescibacterota bacterium]